MSGLKDRVVAAVADLPQRVYTGYIKRGIETVGLRPLLKRGHVRVFQVLNGDTIEVTVDGTSATFTVDSPIVYQRLTGRLQETNEPILESLLSEVESTDVLWDIGAHIGRYSCLLGQKIDTGNLVTIEAHPLNSESLRHNLSLNDIDATVIEKALADTTTQTEFSLRHDQVGEFIRGAEYADGIKNTNRHTVQVDTVPGDILVSEYGCPPPSIIRLDVTGAEPQALDGMSKVLSDDRCRLVYVVQYPDRYDDPRAVKSRLEAYGFETTEIDGWLRAERS